MRSFSMKAMNWPINWKKIWLKCMPLCQSCSVHFYRQVKNYTTKFLKSPVFKADNHEVITQQDRL
jgi:hypothetical protein